MASRGLRSTSTFQMDEIFIDQLTESQMSFESFDIHRDEDNNKKAAQRLSLYRIILNEIPHNMTPHQHTIDAHKLHAQIQARNKNMFPLEMESSSSNVANDFTYSRHNSHLHNTDECDVTVQTLTNCICNMYIMLRTHIFSRIYSCKHASFRPHLSSTLSL